MDRRRRFPSRRSIIAIALGRFHEALLRIEDPYGDLARTRRRSAPHL